MADECETHGETDCTVRLTLHGSAETDAWADHVQKWSTSERTTFDVSDPRHLGWVIGLHACYLAQALVRDRSCDNAATMDGVASAFEEIAQSIRSELEAKDGR